jgi:hypothetical protein
VYLKKMNDMWGVAGIYKEQTVTQTGGALPHKERVRARTESILERLRAASGADRR